jgi:hypothetical protein
MRRSAAILTVFMGLGLFVLGATISSSLQARQPFKEVTPSYDVAIPASCAGKIQELVPATDKDVKIPVMTWLRIKQIVAGCGGSTVEVK